MQRMADALHTESSSLKIRFLSPMFSNTASTICDGNHHGQAGAIGVGGGDGA